MLYDKELLSAIKDNETLCGLFCKYIRRATDELLKE